MKNSNLWLALGRNLLISIGIYGALMLLLWGAQVVCGYSCQYRGRSVYPDYPRPAELRGILCRYSDVYITGCAIPVAGTD